MKSLSIWKTLQTNSKAVLESQSPSKQRIFIYVISIKIHNIPGPVIMSQFKTLAAVKRPHISRKRCWKTFKLFSNRGGIVFAPPLRLYRSTSTSRARSLAWLSSPKVAAPRHGATLKKRRFYRISPGPVGSSVSHFSIAVWEANPSRCQNVASHLLRWSNHGNWWLRGHEKLHTKILCICICKYILCNCVNPSTVSSVYVWLYIVYRNICTYINMCILFNIHMHVYI